MKKLLFIVDNTKLYKEVKEFIDSISYSDACFVCSNASSPLYNHKDFGEKSVLTVKENVAYIINNFDIVFSLHCFQFFPAELVTNKVCINVHPGYNPVNRGWYPQVFAIVNRLLIGATIHEMDAKLDNGPIIAREQVVQYPWDTSEDIYDRVLNKEMELFRNNFKKIIDGSYERIDPYGKANFFSKKDFTELCHLDLAETLTMEEAINKLRALTHGSYKNAFFIDPASGSKVFVKISLEVAE